MTKWNFIHLCDTFLWSPACSLCSAVCILLHIVSWMRCTCTHSGFSNFRLICWTFVKFLIHGTIFLFIVVYFCWLNIYLTCQLSLVILVLLNTYCSFECNTLSSKLNYLYGWVYENCVSKKSVPGLPTKLLVWPICAFWFHNFQRPKKCSKQWREKIEKKHIKKNTRVEEKRPSDISSNIWRSLPGDNNLLVWVVTIFSTLY